MGIAEQDQLWSELSMARGGKRRRSVGVDTEPGKPGESNCGLTRRLMAWSHHSAGYGVKSVRISQFQKKKQNGSDVGVK